MRGLGQLGLLALTLLLGAVAGTTARAQSDYPNKPIRLVVGFTPGSVADITARVLGNRMGQILGQSVVVENRPGAGSNLAAEFAKFIDDELKKWDGVVQDSGIKAR